MYAGVYSWERVPHAPEATWYSFGSRIDAFQRGGWGNVYAAMLFLVAFYVFGGATLWTMAVGFCRLLVRAQAPLARAPLQGP